MAQIQSYILVNNVIKFSPISFEREVSTQQEIEELKKPLKLIYNVDELNKRIIKDNKENNTNTHIYQILFNITQPFDGVLTP